MNTTPKVALVTGASSGFGQATAARLSRQFAHLRSPDPVSAWSPVYLSRISGCPLLARGLADFRPLAPAEEGALTPTGWCPWGGTAAALSASSDACVKSHPPRRWPPAG